MKYRKMIDALEDHPELVPLRDAMRASAMRFPYSYEEHQRDKRAFWDRCAALGVEFSIRRKGVGESLDVRAAMAPGESSDRSRAGIKRILREIEGDQ